MKKNKDINKIADNIEQLTKKLEELGSIFDDVDPLEDSFSDISNMEKSINQLKDILPVKPEETTSDVPPIDGETCMHGNSWHATCSECDELDEVGVILSEIENLIKTEPNDKELGKKIRDFYNSWIEFNEDNSDNTNNIDI